MLGTVERFCAPAARVALLYAAWTDRRGATHACTSALIVIFLPGYAEVGSVVCPNHIV